MVVVDIHGIDLVAISIRVYIIFKICLVLAELFVARWLFSSCAVRASRRGVLSGGAPALGRAGFSRCSSQTPPSTERSFPGPLWGLFC